MGESPQGLLSQAKRNTPLLSPASLETMEAVMKKIIQNNMANNYGEDLVPWLLEEGQEEAPSSLYGLTNQWGIHGAAAMLYPELLKNFADSQGADLAVLPSSVHEVILVPVKGDLDFEWLRCMVRNINLSEVPPEDWLSDQAMFTGGGKAGWKSQNWGDRRIRNREPGAGYKHKTPAPCNCGFEML